MKTRKRVRSQALVEFALLIPLLIFVFVVFIDLGRVIASYSELSNAVREGTRYAAVHIYNEDNIKNVVTHYTPSLDPALMTILPYTTVSCSGCDNIITSVTVAASYVYQPITPGLQMLLGGPGKMITLKVSATTTVTPLYQ